MTTLHQILSIARAGSSVRAWGLFVSAGWDAKQDDPQALTLKGRLFKDQAKLATGAERVRLYGEAAAAYAAAGALERDSYPLINAASLALLGGKPARANELAKEVIALLESDPKQGENDYWRAATRAEALLILDKEAEARAALSEGMNALPEAWEDHAATIGQFELILAEQGRDAAWLDRHRPPISLHFSGMIGLTEDKDIKAAIEKTVMQINPGFAYGALAAGSDILLAEALHRHGTELNIILPYPVEQFLDLSVRPYGDQWEKRFWKLANDEIVVVENLGLEDPPLKPAIDLANQVAMGRALRNASNLQSRAKALTIKGAGEELRSQSVDWQAAGHDLLILEGRRRINGRATDHGATRPPSDQSLQALLWTSNESYVDSEGLDAQAIRSASTSGGRWFSGSDVERIFDLTRNSAATDQMGLVYDIWSDEHPAPQSIIDRAEALAGASEAGTILTDQKGAMALTIAGNAASIEEIGELQTAGGAVFLWSVI